MTLTPGPGPFCPSCGHTHHGPCRRPLQVPTPAGLPAPGPAFATIAPPGPGKALRLISLSPLTFDVIDAPTPPEPRPLSVRPRLMVLSREIGNVLSVLDRTRDRWTADERSMVGMLDGWRDAILTICRELEPPAPAPAGGMAGCRLDPRCGLASGHSGHCKVPVPPEPR